MLEDKRKGTESSIVKPLGVQDRLAANPPAQIDANR